MNVKIDFHRNLSEQRYKQISTLMQAFNIDTSAAIKEHQKTKRIDLLVEEKGIKMRSSDFDAKSWVRISFDTGASKHRRLYGGGKSQSLAKAVGLDKKKDLKILDATAGFAGDSFVMACLGASVYMLERSPILALMIQDSLELARSRSLENKELISIFDAMQLIHADAVDWLAALNQKKDQNFDVIYLDPMFPERKKKAAVKKEMQALQILLEDTDLQHEQQKSDLLDIAVDKAVRRVVVKRPAHAPFLGGQEPSYSLKGKSTRFDIYPKKSMTAN